MSLNRMSEIITQKLYPADFQGHFIGNTWVLPDSKDLEATSLNPSDGTDIVKIRYRYDLATKAIDIAEKRWNSVMFQKDNLNPIDILKSFSRAIGDYSPALKEILKVECGKPAWEADSEIHAAVSFIDQVVKNRQNQMDSSDHDGKITDEPLGISVGFIPFSTPLTSFVHYICGSILANSPLVLMCSYHSSYTVSMLSGLIELLKLPDGSISILFGNYMAFKKALGDRRVKGILYTGSREHCHALRKEFYMQLDRQLILQSGGKNSVVIGETADVEKSAWRVILGAFKSAGQLCHSTSRVFVSDKVFDDFCDILKKGSMDLEIGPTHLAGEGPFMGPLYSKKAVEKFLRFQTMAKRESIDTLLWGKATNNKDQGFFVEPGIHILEKLDYQSAYQNNILMAPDIAIYRYKNSQEFITGINSTDAAFVCSLMGEHDEFKSIEGCINTPNIRYNKATVEFNDIFPVAGKEQCGQHRFGLVQLDKLLSYPKYIDTDSSELLMEKYLKK